MYKNSQAKPTITRNDIFISPKKIPKKKTKQSNKPLVGSKKCPKGYKVCKCHEAIEMCKKKKEPEIKKGKRGGRYTEDKTKDGRPYRRYFDELEETKTMG